MFILKFFYHYKLEKIKIKKIIINFILNFEIYDKKVLNKFYSYLITTIYQGNLNILILYIDIIIEKTLIILDLSDFWRLIIFLLDLIYLKN